LVVGEVGRAAVHRGKVDALLADHEGVGKAVGHAAGVHLHGAALERALAARALDDEAVEAVAVGPGRPAAGVVRAGGEAGEGASAGTVVDLDGGGPDGAVAGVLVQGLLLDEGEDVVSPAPVAPVGRRVARIAAAGGGQGVIGVVVAVEREADLLKVVFAGHA